MPTVCCALLQAQTALHYAAANGQTAVVQLLSEKGAMIDLGCFMVCLSSPV